MKELSTEQVCAVIVTYNIGKRFYNCYDNIKNQVDSVIIVDNGSDIETIKELKSIEKNSKTKIIYNNSNKGIAKALNIGIDIALLYGYEFILTLDHDTISSPNMVNKMLSIYNSISNSSNVGIIYPRVYDVNKGEYIANVKHRKDRYSFANEAIQSGSMIHSSVFKKIGNFNEDLFIYYVDTDFYFRVIMNGFDIKLIDDIEILHEEGKKEEKQVFNKKFYYNNYSNIAIYYRARNNIYMLKRYFRYFNGKDRLIKDFIKILIFDKERLVKIKYLIMGVWHGIRNRYGKLLIKEIE